MRAAKKLLLYGKRKIALLNPSVSVSSGTTTITVIATSTGSLANAVFGVEWKTAQYPTPPSGYTWSQNVAGVAKNQSITISGPNAPVAGDIVNVRCYYNLDLADGTSTRVYGPLIAPYVVSLTSDAPTGTAQVGQTLTAPNPVTIGTSVAAAGGDGMTLAYQWYSGASPVGTDADTYVPVTGDVGNTITVKETYTNTKSASTTSAATSAVTSAAVAIDVKSTNGEQQPTNTYSWSHPATSSASTAFIHVAWATSQTVSSATYGGTEMTLVGTDTIGTRMHSVYALPNLIALGLTGAQTVSVVFSGAPPNAVVEAVTITNGDATNANRAAAVIAHNTTTNPTTLQDTVGAGSSAVNDLVLGFFIVNGASGPLSATGCTLEYDNVCYTTLEQGGYSAAGSASAVTLQADWVAGQDCSFIAFSAEHK